MPDHSGRPSPVNEPSDRAGCPINAVSCPTPQQLSDFCRGVGEVETAEQLAEIVDRCSACESFVSQCESEQLSRWQRLQDPLEAAWMTRSRCGRRLAARPLTKTAWRPVIGSPSMRSLTYSVAGEWASSTATRDPSLNRDVALKTIRSAAWASAEAVAMFMRKAHAAARLEHAGIVPVFDIGVQDDLHYLTMQLIDGPNLADAAKQRNFSFDDIADIVRQVADAVVHAHLAEHHPSRPEAAKHFAGHRRCDQSHRFWVGQAIGS